VNQRLVNQSALNSNSDRSRTTNQEVNLPAAPLWAWLGLPLPSIACALLTVWLESLFTHAGFFHLFLVATPFSCAFGLAAGGLLSVYLARSRWCFLLVLIQTVVVVWTYLAVSRPSVELFP